MNYLSPLLLLLLAGCRVTDIPFWKPPPMPEACEVATIKNVAYQEGPDADEFRHRLDVYLPQGKKGFPVVFLVHGGAWMIGDNRCCGLYSSVGEFLAGQGVGVVMPNYRLAPGVKHPAHIQDVARAFAWTHANIERLGGRRDQIYLVGHSAGGHLVALLTTDESYLKAEGLSTKDIKGVVGVSGVYHIPQGPLEVRVGGTMPESFHFASIGALRGPSPAGPLKKDALAGLPLRVNIFGLPFGNDPQTRAAASPITHVRAGLPPFLLINAESDLPVLPRQAEEFAAALKEKGVSARCLRIEERNHNSVFFSAIERDDPVARAILEMIQ